MIEIRISKVTGEDVSEISRRTNLNAGIDSAAHEIVGMFFEAMQGLGYLPISVAQAMHDKAEEMIDFYEPKEE
jgi:hypothetical protein